LLLMATLKINMLCNGGLLIINYIDTFPVFLLNNEQAIGAQTPIIQLAHVLHLVNGKLYSTALALGE